MTATAVKERAIPKRIQRRRTKGWRMPRNAVYVGRPSKWGNPYTAEEWGADAVPMFQAFVETNRRPANGPTLRMVREELRGKDLACWCPLDQPCHADVLLKLANA